jgi:S-adenosylmethionine decarboxylase
VINHTSELKTQETAAKAETVHEASGSHLLLTLTDCKADILNDLERLKELAIQAAAATGANVLNVCGQKFEPQGVTVVVVLAESHASLHTYPEVRKVFWDCFTCGTTCDPSKSVEVLERALAANAAYEIVCRQ